MTDQDKLRDKIADGVLRMHRIIGTTGRTGRVVCCSCDRTWRDHAQYQRHLAQAIIDEFGLTVETYVDLGALPDHLQGVWMDDPAFREWEAGQPRKTRIVGKWEQ